VETAILRASAVFTVILLVGVVACLPLCSFVGHRGLPFLVFLFFIVPNCKWGVQIMCLFRVVWLRLIRIEALAHCFLLALQGISVAIPELVGAPNTS
jgi:hypothetical protein